MVAVHNWSGCYTLMEDEVSWVSPYYCMQSALSTSVFIIIICIRSHMSLYYACECLGKYFQIKITWNCFFVVFSLNSNNVNSTKHDYFFVVVAWGQIKLPPGQIQHKARQFGNPDLDSLYTPRSLRGSEALYTFYNFIYYNFISIQQCILNKGRENNVLHPLWVCMLLTALTIWLWFDNVQWVKLHSRILSCVGMTGRNKRSLLFHWQ